MIKLLILFALSFSGCEALCDPISNPSSQMKRQRELVDQSTNRRPTVEQELRHKVRAEINIENAIQEFNNQP